VACDIHMRALNAEGVLAGKAVPACSAAASSLWPVPLTPAYSEHAHEIEVRRAAASNTARAVGASSQPVTALVTRPSLLVVHKPAGAYCEDVAARIAAHSHGFVELAHRLDRDTSGALCLATSKQSLTELRAAFSRPGVVRKAYVALAHITPDWCGAQSSRLVTGHGRSRHGLWRAYAHSDCGRDLPHGGGKVKEMETALQWFGPPDEDGKVLLLAIPVQGRTHQVRLHAALAGTPLSGDVRYGGPQNEQDAVLLHAAWLRVPTPGGAVEVRAPWPDWLQRSPSPARGALLAAIATAFETR
jgi:23S rRNA-/tRNA-specific pseudouridylate synthase